MTCCSTTAEAIITTERTTRIRNSQPASAGQCSANSVAGARCVEQVDQPADRPVHRRVDGAGQPAGDQQQDERALRLVGEIEDEAPGVGGQHFPVGVLERIDRALDRAPQAVAETAFGAHPGLVCAHRSSDRQPCSTIGRVRSHEPVRRWRCTVLPCMSACRLSWIAASTSESSAEVALSSTNIGTSVRKTRAIATRCRWPPDNFTPRSSTNAP